MPADTRHIYLRVPLDHLHPELGELTLFYLLSPNFHPGEPVVLFLTDGQMQLVDTSPNWDFFESQLPGASYVLLGHRGHPPTLLPEVYPHGRLDMTRALQLYGSAQIVEDLEAVRRDLAARQLLPPDGRVSLFGASGAGVLAQQYLAHHGDSVKRALLAVTGAPDLSARMGEPYARNLDELDPTLDAALQEVVRSNRADAPTLAYLVYQLSREGSAGRERARGIVDALLADSSLPYWRALLEPRLNFAFARLSLAGPEADAVKVRMLELAGRDLTAYRTGKQSVHPMYEWVASLLGPWIDTRAPLPEFSIDRSRFAGELLVVSGTDDIVFAPKTGRAIAGEFSNARYCLAPGGHRLELSPERHAALRAAFFTHGLGSPEFARASAELCAGGLERH